MQRSCVPPVPSVFISTFGLVIYSGNYLKTQRCLLPFRGSVNVRCRVENSEDRTVTCRCRSCHRDGNGYRTEERGTSHRGVELVEPVEEPVTPTWVGPYTDRGVLESSRVMSRPGLQLWLLSNNLFLFYKLRLLFLILSLQIIL